MNCQLTFIQSSLRSSPISFIPSSSLPVLTLLHTHLHSIFHMHVSHIPIPFYIFLTFPLHSTYFSHSHSIPHISHSPTPFYIFLTFPFHSTYFSCPHSIPHVSHVPTPFHIFLTAPLHATCFSRPHYHFTVFPFHPCPSLSLQSFLKGIYVSWITSKPVDLEPLIAELLTDMRLPSIDCLPIKKPFGALKEVVLHPVHEDTTLPYTSTAAIQLLRSIGRTSLKFYIIFLASS